MSASRMAGRPIRRPAELSYLSTTSLYRVNAAQYNRLRLPTGEVTGGRAFFVKKASELAEVYQRIAEELRTQYVVSYQTDNQTWDGRWIKLKVETDRKDVEVRARRGYFAVRSASGG